MAKLIKFKLKKTLDEENGYYYESKAFNDDNSRLKNNNDAISVVCTTPTILTQINLLSQVVQLETGNAQESKQERQLDAYVLDTRSYASSCSSVGGSSFTVEWRELNLFVSSKFMSFRSEKSKQLLTNASGSFKSGEMTAILGPSGAGKSTLADCIVGKLRQSGASLSGTTRVIFDDKSVEAKRRAANELFRFAIIPQQDNLFDLLTVAETLMFASQLKNAHLRNFNHIENVTRVMTQLGLTECAAVKCGKLSGGQYKRVSIAQELLSRPDILLLDEPTSGLDSITCFHVMNTLKGLTTSASRPLAIVAIIHQPDSEVLDLFDKTYTLAGGGRPIFEGRAADIFQTIASALDDVRGGATFTGNSKGDQSLSRLDALLAARRCNPARLVVEVAAGEFGGELIDTLATAHHQNCSSLKSSPGSTSRVWSNKNSPLSSPKQQSTFVAELTSKHQHNLRIATFNYDKLHSSANINHFPVINNKRGHERRPRARLDSLLKIEMGAKGSRQLSTFSERVCFFLSQLKTHTRRSWLTVMRDPLLCTIQVVLHILIPLLLVYTFQKHNIDACPRVKQLDVIVEAYSNSTLIDDVTSELRLAIEAEGFFFIWMYVLTFAAICGNALTYPLVMRVLVKEFRNGWYSASSYFIGRTLAEAPLQTFNTIIFAFICYYLGGQPVSNYEWRFLSIVGMTVLSNFIAQSQGLFLGAILMNSPQSTVFIAPSSTAPLVVVCGFVIRLQSLPSLLKQGALFSYFTVALRGVLISRYGFNRCECDDEILNAESEHKIPDQARGLIDIWVDTYRNEFDSNADNNNSTSTTPDVTSKMLDAINKARKFGFDVQSCDQVKPYAMLDQTLHDSDLVVCFVSLMLMLISFRLITYVVMRWKINKCM